ncbi:MAG: hypothetical protein R2825_12630 [Saprospiraceae bacterium]
MLPIGTEEICGRAGLRGRAVVGGTAVADVGGERAIAIGIELNVWDIDQQWATGAWLSTTLNEQLAVTVLKPSVTVRVTTCGPALQLKFMAGLVSVAEQLSVEELSPILAWRLPLPLPLSTTSGMLAGQTATGASASSTVTFAVQEAWLPEASNTSTSTGTVYSPANNRPPPGSFSRN